MLPASTNTLPFRFELGRGTKSTESKSVHQTAEGARLLPLRLQAEISVFIVPAGYRLTCITPADLAHDPAIKRQSRQLYLLSACDPRHKPR